MKRSSPTAYQLEQRIATPPGCTLSLEENAMGITKIIKTAVVTAGIVSAVHGSTEPPKPLTQQYANYKKTQQVSTNKNSRNS